jgi:hypothetical protein
MKQAAFVLSLVLSAIVAVTGANAGTGKAMTLMVKELPDFPGKDGMVEVVTSHLGKSRNLIATMPTCLSMSWKGASSPKWKARLQRA